jgi:hypothetical protein
MTKKLNDWERVTWDLTTGHVTENDAYRLAENNYNTNWGFRSRTHEYGWVIFIPCGLEGEEVVHWIDTLKANNWSDALVNILVAAVKADVSLINFDQDGNFHDDFPTFEW